jgi:hypothetical protein
MRQASLRLAATSVLAFASLAATAGAINGEQVMRPSGKGYGIPEDRPGMIQIEDQVTGKSVKATAQIKFHGGPVMTSSAGTNVYLIWYGNWSGNTGTTIVPDFLNNEGGSPYFAINTTYYDASSTYVTNAVTLKGQTTDNYSQGTSLTDAKVFSVVKSAISSGRLPKDANAVYFVLTSADVKETSGFCSQYCGWHTNGTVSTSDIKYSFVGNADQCPTSCEAQTTSPNGNPGVDGMISVIAHELEEAVTDPDGNAWYFASGNENADQCAWTFGTEYTAANGSKANMKLGSRDFLIQQNWIRATSGKCALHL